MTTREVRIFPHSTEEFGTEDNLRTWLLNSLRGNGGVYHLKRVPTLPVGSIVLFRYKTKIIGEAVVRKEPESLTAAEKNLRADDKKYTAKITFSPLYAPPVLVGKIDKHRKKKPILPMGFQRLPWEDYAFVLEQVVTKGSFVS